MKSKSILYLLMASMIFMFLFTSCILRDKQTANNPVSQTTTTQPASTAPSKETTVNPTQPFALEPTSEKITTASYQDIATLAASLVGKPYQYGAAGPDAFDNSGFLVYCFAQNQIMLPRKTGDIAKAGTAIDKQDLLPGDIVFFYNDNPEKAEYAGIYLGDNQFAASNNEKHPVSVQSLTAPYFEKRFLFARRYQ